MDTPAKEVKEMLKKVLLASLLALVFLTPALASGEETEVSLDRYVGGYFLYRYTGGYFLY